MKSFLKIYICAGENEPKTESVHIETQPILRASFKEGSPGWKFAKKCSLTIGEIIDNLTEEERNELRQELREFLSEET